MKTLIIYAHPWDGSFNRHVLDLSEKTLKENGHKVDIIDLNKDGFDPVMRKEDLKLFSKGEYHDKQAENYIERLKTADNIVLIYPIWWYAEPAILKGFFDKVFLKGHVYDEVETGIKTILSIKQATIITTANLSKEDFEEMGDPVINVIGKGTLGVLAPQQLDWIHCKHVHEESEREIFLNKIKKHFSK